MALRNKMYNILVMAPLLVLFIVGVTGLSKNEDYYTSLIGIQQLAKKEQIILSSVLNYRVLLMERLALLDK